MLHPPESFRSLLLRHRGRTGLIQRDLASRAGISRGALQDWEAGGTYPTAERLQALIRVLLETGGLTAGQEASEARELWAAAERESPRMHTPFDGEWFAALLALHSTRTARPGRDTVAATDALGHAEDWGEAPVTRADLPAGVGQLRNLFEAGDRGGTYRGGMAGYGRLLLTVGQATHQSCLVLTSREALPELGLLGDAVRTLELNGLGVDEARVLLGPKQLAGTVNTGAS